MQPTGREKCCGSARPGEKIDYLTREYQILLYLYPKPAPSNSELMRLVDASATKFNTALKELLENGVIICGGDPDDGRRKRYELPRQVCSEIEAAHHRVFAWLGLKQQHVGEPPGRGHVSLTSHMGRVGGG